MGSYTTNYQFYLPEIGETGWGTLVNQNFTILDTKLNSGADIRAERADKLTTARSFSITDGTNTGTAVSFDGSANVSLRMPTSSNVTGNIISNGHNNQIGNCWPTLYSGGSGDIEVLSASIGRTNVVSNELYIYYPVYHGFVGDFDVEYSLQGSRPVRFIIKGYSYSTSTYGKFEISPTDTISLNHFIFSISLVSINDAYSYGFTLKCATPTFKIY